MKHLYTALAFCMACALPAQAMAMGQIRAEESIAGIGLEVGLEGVPAQTSLTVLLRAPDATVTRYDVQTNSSGNAQLDIPGYDTQRAGEYTLNALEDRTTIADEARVLIRPDSSDLRLSDITVWTPRIAADARDSADISVTMRDRYGNPLADRPVMVVASRADDTVLSVTPATDAQGVQHFRLTTRSPGTSSLRAIDLLSGRTLPTTASITAGATAMGGNGMFYPSVDSATATRPFYAQVAGFDVIDGFEIIAPPQMPINQEAQKITVRAVDRNGITVEDYVGTVQFTSTDPEATLPNFGTYTFKERDLGEKSFPLVLKFRTTGTQTLRVEDANNPAVRGETDIAVGGGSTPTQGGSITVTSHQPESYINSESITIEGRGPRFANLIVMGGIQDETGSTDENGAFSIPISLNPGQRDYTIRVRDDAGRNDSGPIHLIMDQQEPAIGTIAFSPEKPEPGENVLVVVTSDEGLASMTLQWDDTELTLPENETKPGTYQAFFPAPDMGAYQPTVVAVDRAGNVSELRVSLGVGSASLPIVQNVRAQAGVQEIAVTWNPVEGAESYRVYVGDSPQNLISSIDTASAATGATLTGLESGRSYVVAVTALAQGKESAERSTTVAATPLGLTLRAQAGNGHIVLSWEGLPSDVPLSAYLLAYGVDASALAEQRMLNAQSRTTTVRDLINGVPYVLQLTPIAVTGQPLTDLAITATATPTGSGFVIGPRDDIPGGSLHPGASRNPPVSTPASGSSTILWMSVVCIAAAGIVLRAGMMRRSRKSAAFIAAIQRQYDTVER